MAQTKIQFKVSKNKQPQQFDNTNETRSNLKQELQTFFLIVLNQFSKDSEVSIRHLITKMAKREEGKELLFNIADMLIKFKQCTKEENHKYLSKAFYYSILEECDPDLNEEENLAEGWHIQVKRSQGSSSYQRIDINEKIKATLSQRQIREMKEYTNKIYMIQSSCENKDEANNQLEELHKTNPKPSMKAKVKAWLNSVIGSIVTEVEKQTSMLNPSKFEVEEGNKFSCLQFILDEGDRTEAGQHSEVDEEVNGGKKESEGETITREKVIETETQKKTFGEGTKFIKRSNAQDVDEGSRYDAEESREELRGVAAKGGRGFRIRGPGFGRSEHRFKSRVGRDGLVEFYKVEEGEDDQEEKATTKGKR